jgi:hypothetical protein
MMYGRFIGLIDSGIDKFADKRLEPRCDFPPALDDPLNVLIKRDPVILSRSLS